MKTLFYPGCSMQRSARPYLDSLYAIQKDLDLELEEVEDWNCCGATEYMSISRLPAFGGTFAIQEPAVSAKMGRDRIRDHIDNGAEFIVSGDMSCLMHLQGLIEREKYPVKVIHLAEIMNHPAANGQGISRKLFRRPKGQGIKPTSAFGGLNT